MDATVTPDDLLVVPPWANGPDDSGNGGWTAGLLAAHVADAATGCAVNLRVPPPLGRELRVEADGAGVRLLDDVAAAEPVLVADAHPVQVDVVVPDAVLGLDVARAAAARAGFPFRDRHPFARCVSCGTQRPDGAVWLHLHCGPVPGLEVADLAGTPTPVFADTWTPGPDVADAAHPSHVAIAACWSALDCPSAAPFADPDAPNPSVLARIAVRLVAPVRVGETYVVAAWRLAVDGRKQRSASVLVDATGAVAGVAEALWIEVRPR
ncbi:MAG: hypothetical protein JWM98_2520 [Thermoleophilia bacterium]|nr:hypothetical protein [Thermoleophilia bacterium]